MNKRRLIPALALVLGLLVSAQELAAQSSSAAKNAASTSKAAAPKLQWHQVTPELVNGQGWKDTSAPFARLPDKAEAMVRTPVWSLAQHTSGINVQFKSDAPRIRVRWTLSTDRIQMNHMPATGVSGVDLYYQSNDAWRYAGTARPGTKVANEADLISGWTAAAREYLLYFPLYNGVTQLEIGVPEGASFEFVPASTDKPVVIYGTSITQGGCATRPGMSYTSILGRKLGVPVMNLGFSGNGQGEPELAELLAELNPSVYVLDPLPNMQAAQVTERIPKFVEILRAKHPTVPIVLVEYPNTPSSDANPGKKLRVDGSNANLKQVYDQLIASGDKNLYYIPGGKLLGDDDEGTVDTTHPTDLGFLRMAEEMAPYLKKVLEQQ